MSDNGAGGTTNYAAADGSTGEFILYNYGDQRLATKSFGIDVTGEVQCDSLDVDGAADITGNVTLHANLDLQDNDKILLGTGDDLQIYHSGSASHITDSGTGDLIIQGNNLRLTGSSGNMLYATDGAETSLYYNGFVKLYTKDDGVAVSGELNSDSLDVDGAAHIAGDLTLEDTDTGSSAGPELLLYRNSSSPADGDYLGQIKFQGESDTGATRNYAKITGKISDASNGTEDGILEFAFLKAGSQNINARWTSTELMLLNGTHLSLQDSQEIRVGAGDDLKIYHDGSKSFITNNGSTALEIVLAGDLILRGTDNVYLQSGTTDETFFKGTVNGAAELYYDNSKKFETTSNGVKITGGLQDGDGDLGTSGQVLSSTGTVLNWVDPDCHKTSGCSGS